MTYIYFADALNFVDFKQLVIPSDFRAGDFEMSMQTKINLDRVILRAPPGRL